MLRADSKWTLLVRKPATKKSICLWVWLGSARKSAFGQLCRRERARELSIICKKKTSKDHRLDPQWGRRRVGLPCACEPTARGVRSEGCPCCLHQPWNAQRGCFERPAPRSVPNTAPDPPLPPGFGSPRARGGTRLPHTRSGSSAVGVEFKKPDVTQAEARSGRLALAARKAPSKRADFSRKTLRQVRRKR